MSYQDPLQPLVSSSINSSSLSAQLSKLYLIDSVVISINPQHAAHWNQIGYLIFPKCSILLAWVSGLATNILFNNLRQIVIGKCRVKTMVFPSSYVRIWELDHKEGWALKIWCFWIMVLEKTLERPLDNKGIKPVNAKGIQLWIFLERTEPEALILLMRRADSLEKTLILGKIESRRRREW